MFAIVRKEVFININNLSKCITDSFEVNFPFVCDKADWCDLSVEQQDIIIKETCLNILNNLNKNS